MFLVLIRNEKRAVTFSALAYRLRPAAAPLVPWLALRAAAYLATLFGLTDHLLSMERDAAFRLIVQVLTGFNLAAFALAWFFNRQPNASQGKLPEGI